jgi:dynactin-4
VGQIDDLAQLQKINTQPETIQNEFDALKDHLEGYITTTVPVQTPRPKGKQPSRHISHLTQMAAKALGRDVPGMMGRPKRKEGLDKGKEKAGWDELEAYKTERAWRGLLSVEGEDRAGMEMTWSKAWAGEGYGNAKYVMRINITYELIRLQTKLTKRCPEASCRHLLIQPDTKSTRFKIKMVAMSYLPAIELGRRRHRTSLDQSTPADTPEDMERRRRDRRRTRVPAKEEDEPMTKTLTAGEVVSPSPAVYLMSSTPFNWHSSIPSLTPFKSASHPQRNEIHMLRAWFSCPSPTLLSTP